MSERNNNEVEIEVVVTCVVKIKVDENKVCDESLLWRKVFITGEAREEIDAGNFQVRLRK